MLLTGLNSKLEPAMSHQAAHCTKFHKPLTALTLAKPVREENRMQYLFMVRQR